MGLQFLYKLALTFHITGFTMLSGATLASFVCMIRVWPTRYAEGAGRYQELLKGLSRVAIMGSILLLVAGASMITIIVRSGPVVPQLWFQIKMVLVLLLLFDIAFVGSRQTGRLRKVLKQAVTANRKEVILARIRQRLCIFYTVQLLLIFIIFILSAFRFT